MRASLDSKRRRSSDMILRGPVAITVGIGILLSVLAAQTVQTIEERRAEADFQLAAGQTIGAIEERIETQIELIRSVVSFFESSDGITRADFKSFVSDSLRRHPSIQLVGWVPRVPAAQRPDFEAAARGDGLPNYRINERSIDGRPIPAGPRPEYFPNLYIEPPPPTEDTFGLDQASDRLRRAALERARDTGELVFSERLELALVTENRTAILAYAPVFSGQEKSPRVEVRQRELVGYAYGVVRPSRIVEEMVQTNRGYIEGRTLPMRIDIYDTTDPTFPKFLFFYRTAGGGSAQDPPDTIVRGEDDFVTSAVFGGREWTFVARPAGGVLANEIAWQTILAFGASIVLSILLAGYLQMTLSRARAIEEEVSLRTNELQLTNELLRGSEERVRIVTNSLSALIAHVDRDMRVQFLNERFNVLNIDVENAPGKPLWDVMGRERYENIRIACQRALLGESSQVELSTVALDGRRLSILTDFTPDIRADGEILGFYLVALNVTAQRALEIELDRFFRQSPNFMCVATYDGFLRRFNDTWTSELGYDADELISVPYIQLVHPDDQPKLEAALKRLQGEGGVTNLEIRMLHKDGSERFVLWNMAAERHERRIFATGHDISELKAVDRMKDEFVSTVSHELRTPLTSIKGALGLMRAKTLGSLPADMNTMLEIAYKNCDRLVLLINDILDIEKIEAGKMDFRMEPIDIVATVRNAVAANQSYADQFGVRIELHNGLAAATVRADEGRIMQVMANLLSNAAKFSPEGGRIDVRVERHSDRAIRISVQDRGPGIPENFRGRIFEKFSQHDSSDRRKVSGTGLGLSIVRAIVERHGGRIDFDSETETGTTFFVDLPDADAPPANGTGNASRILVCEDDPDVAAVLRGIVERCGYAADVALTVAEASSLLEQRAYAGMTLDIVLPDMSGIEFFKKLRSDPRTRLLPVIIVSVQAAESAVKINGSAINVVDWLDKPFDDKRLEHAIRSAIAMSAESAKRILHVEDDSDLIQIVSRQIGNNAAMVSAGSIAAAKGLLGRERFDLVILDLLLPDGPGEDLLPLMRNPDGTPIPVIVFSALEVPLDIARRVEAALVKTRSTDRMLINAIDSFITRGSSTHAGAGPAD